MDLFQFCGNSNEILQWYVIVIGHMPSILFRIFYICIFLYICSIEVGGSFYGVLCGSRQSLWVEYNMSFWITHFYISKYYEFIDTWIVLFKGNLFIVYMSHLVCMLIIYLGSNGWTEQMHALL